MKFGRGGGGIKRKKGGPTHLYKCVPMKMQGETLE